MFQPQATPFAFNTYGVGLSSPVADFPATTFQPTSVTDSGGPTLFRDPIFNQYDNNNNHHHNNSNNNSRPRYKMDNGMSDMAAQEALAREFQPPLEGPLVGEKKSSAAITAEYARADPVYVAKTANLPQTYSHYRPILGDGNCGWRAAGFSYFETLLRTGDHIVLETEIARMTSLNNLLATSGGFDAWIFEDMVEETTNLLRDLASLVQTSPQAASDLLQERFNTPEISNTIVYHLRLLASSWLAGHQAAYQDYIVDLGGVEGYRKNVLEPVDNEIDHIGMVLLVDVLLKPIGFAVEIVYLDRSEGTSVNTHILQSEDANGVPTNPGGPTIYLLYRPSHYDILYKDSSNPPIQAIPQATHNPSVQVQRVAFNTQQQSIQSAPMDFTLDLQGLLTMPGFGGLPQQHSYHGLSSQYTSPIDQTYAPSPISSMSPVSSGASSATSPSSAIVPLYSTQSFMNPKLTKPMAAPSHPSFAQGTTLPVHSHPPPHPPALQTQSIPPSELPSPSSAGGSFRPSKYEWEAGWAHEGPVQFLTSTFKNSHYNTAHYNNPNFQPEEWSPDTDDPPPTRKRSG